MSFKKSLIICISVVLMLFPRLELDGCGPILYDEEFRFWLFQPNLVNNEALLPFTYSTNLYFQTGSKTESLAEVFDTTYEQVNVKEWQTEVPSATDKDIYKLVYDTDPQAYKRQVKGDSLKTNTFYQGLKAKPDLLTYFNFAKDCEAVFSGGTYNQTDWEWKIDSVGIKKIAQKGENTVKTAKTPFIRLRTAYQLIKAYEYLQNTEGVIKTFDTYLKDSKSNSWILGSALYYYAKAQPTPELRNLWAANCFDVTVDKKLQSLKLVNADHKATTLAMAKTEHQRGLATTMMALRHPGRGLNDLKTIYAADPMQSELPMLIEREINKLEDWLYSFSLTGNDTYVSRSIREPKKKNDAGETYFDDPKYSDEKKYEEIQKANWAADRLYLNEVTDFVAKLISENKVKDRAFILLAGAHLAFLKQDFKQLRQYLADLKTLPNVRANIQVQAELTNVLCDLNVAPISAMTEENIARFESVLQKNKKEITDFGTFREQVYLFIGKKFIEQGKIAKGCLLTMLTNRFTNYVGFYQENAYHRLYSLGKPADFDEAIRIVSTPKTNFEKLIAAEKRPYREEYGYYDEKKQEWVEVKNPREWDVNKIKDYKLTYFIRNDQIDSALKVAKTIPRNYWQKEPYQAMLNCNPFYVDVVHPHTVTFADSIKYNKITFLERVVALRNEAQKNPSVAAQNYYLLGNAYYNMTWKGNFWLMSDIYWGAFESHSDYFKSDTTFINTYFGLTRAQKYYEMSLNSTTDEKLAALNRFMIGYCAKTREDYFFYQKVSRWDDNAPKPPAFKNPADVVYNQKFPNRLKDYSGAKYWCTNYESLAKLYSGF
ncbi:MAG: hypothetical protein JNL70_11880 [Saprospiraceae bacterium]|nr:hypothetical protein [Saprospiraceae bacterium]